jgi:NAD(P)-dependent dehydrogenase (short-subunit alcohol dehydrogenase family)
VADVERVAVVTGGASGIGLGIVRHLLGEGMAVVALDRDAGACKAAQQEFSAAKARFVTGDVGTPAGASLAIDTAVKEFGRLDLLCNNAAVHPLETIEEHDLDTWRETFRVNVDGALLCSQRALPHLKATGGGTIVNIGSIAGSVPYATGAAYAASKAALTMLTRVLALEAGPFGITVNCISPGAIRHRPADAGDTAPPGHIPIGRHGKPEDVAQMVSYLASDAAGYITGTVITLDGGATAGRARQSRRK